MAIRASAAASRKAPMMVLALAITVTAEPPASGATAVTSFTKARSPRLFMAEALGRT